MLDDLLAQHRIREAAADVLARGVGSLPAALGGRGVRADLLAGHIVELLVERGEARRLFAVVDAWLIAHEFRLPRRCGDFDRPAAVASTYLAERLRAGLTAVFAGPAPALSDREQFLLVFLWRQFFLNPFSAINLAEDPPSPPSGARPVVESLFRPFDAPDSSSAADLWDGEGSLAEKMVVALWLMNLPEIGLDERLRDRALANLIRLCRGARRAPPPGTAFKIFVDEAMSALFRASYAGGNTCEGLSALGDLIAEEMPRVVPLPPPAAPPPRARPRIGYVSTFFRAHPVSFYMGNRIIHHDRERFEVVTFAIGQRRDWMTDLVRRGSDEFVELLDGDDLSGIARAIQARALDLLVFADIGMDVPTHLLAGLTLAPRQIALMGHGTSTGMPTLSHYFSGDHEGPEGERHYRERLVRLPHLGAAQHAPPPPPPGSWRRDLAIPDDAVVLINLNNGIKLLPDRDGVYMEILTRLPRAYLVLKPHFEPASRDGRLTRRLQAAAERRGVADRLRIVPPLRRSADVASLLAAADVHLDTFPFGGWTTNLDALAAGLPMVTQEGDVGRSRWGAGFLRAMDISEGIAAGADEYVDWAVRLGEDAALRARLRARVRDRAAGLFFDGAAAQPAYEEALRAVLTAAR